MSYLSGRKRKRTSYNYSAPRAVKRTRTTTSTVAPASRTSTYYGRTKGYYRKVGNFGRFQGSGGTEYKVYDQVYSGTFDSTGEVLQAGGSSTGLNVGIASGTREFNRIGAKICVKSIYVRGTLTLTGQPTDTYRMALVLDKQANGAYPSYSDIYNYSGNNTFDYLAPINITNSERFVVLKEWFQSLTVSAYDASSYGSTQRSFKKYLKVDLPIDYNGTTGAITEVKSNNLLLVGASLNDDITTYSISCRLRYSDK